MTAQAEQVCVTARQAAIMDFIRSYSADNGFAPSQAEIADHFGFASQTAVVDHVRALIAKRCVAKAPGKSRSVVVTEIGLSAIVKSARLSEPA